MKLVRSNTRKVDIKKLRDMFINLWWNSGTELNLDLKTNDYFEKKREERKIDKFIDEVINMIESYPESEEQRKAWKKNADSFFNDVVKNQPSLKLGVIDEEMKTGFIRSTKLFINQCKTFDNKLSYEDIGQALRNVWIVSILQKAFGRRVEFNRAIFGYSMLYPYTDNYLDDITISMTEKVEFNKRFSKRLGGENIQPKGNREEKIFQLVSFIEEIYPRDVYEGVYNSLGIIHSGQINSLSQQEGISNPYEKDILGISIEKGGASVLADGYLIDGELDFEEEKFAYGYGFFLQLCDDLQDVKNDAKCGHMTVMSQLAGKYELDKVVNKVINLLYLILENEKSFKCTNVKEVKQLIEDNCILMIIFAVVMNKEYFSKEYVREINKYLPFTVGYINNLSKHINKKIKRLEKKFTSKEIEEIFEYLLED